MAKSRTIITSKEIGQRLNAKGRNLFYSHVWRNKIEGVTRHESGWGFSITRKGFEAWLREHPQAAAQPSEIESAVKL